VVQSLNSAEPSAALPGNSGVDVGLSTEDLFAFVKTLEMTAAKKPGPLAVPTNTPLGYIPSIVALFLRSLTNPISLLIL